MTEQMCLSETIYHEARGQPFRGQLAIAFVVLNRAKENDTSLCQVIRERNQFPWIRNQRLRNARKSLPEWTQSQSLAETFINNPDQFTDPTLGATAFQRRGRSAALLGRQYRKTVTISGHTFYRSNSDL